MTQAIVLNETPIEYRLLQGFGLLVYDLPYPPERDRKKYGDWLRVYDNATRALRALGTPIQNSVVILSLERKAEAQQVILEVEDMFRKLSERFTISKPNIKIVELTPKTGNDALAMLDVIKNHFKTTLQTLVEHYEKKLQEAEDEKEEKQLLKRLRENLRQLRKQDVFGVLNDPELQKLLYQLEILFA